jgi:protease-4
MRVRRRTLLGRIWRGIVLLFRLIARLFSLLIVISILFSFIFMIFLFRETSRTPKMKPGTVLVLPMRGLIVDGPGMDVTTQRLLGEDVQTRQGIITNIRKGAHDPNIIAILLKMEGHSMGLTSALDIREELLKFKETGKRLFAYMPDAGLRTYLLVSVADKIYIAPSGYTLVRGLRAEVPFYKEMFEKIGVTPEFVAIGKYKTAPQIFTMDHMSDEYREVLTDLLDAYYSMYVQKIAEARNVSRLQVTSWIDDGLYTAREALLAGMVDELVYESQLEKRLQVELGLIAAVDRSEEEVPEVPTESETEKEQESKLNIVNHAQYARVEVDAPGLHEEGEKIAVIYASGTIVSGRGSPYGSGASIGADTMTELLDSLADDDDIKGIILRIDSGGGGVSASDEIRASVQETVKKKPVIVSMADVAASGGYMIAAPAESIVAYPLTITGSIGIFGGKFSMEGLADLVGVNIESIQRGENAGLLTSSRVHTSEEQERFRNYVQRGYDEFVDYVARGRNMTFDAVDDVAQGRIWTGEQAVELGLVDELGGLDTAIALLKKKLDIPEEGDVQLVTYPRPGTPFDIILQRFRDTLIFANVPEEMLDFRNQLEVLAELQHEHRFAWWPCQLVVE